MSGNARGPSTAFNLLFRLCQLRPSTAQVRQMLDSRDSPYIRALALLFLRYVCAPRQLWDWFSKYVDDEEVRGRAEGRAGGGGEGRQGRRRPRSGGGCCAEAAEAVGQGARGSRFGVVQRGS